MVGPGRAAGVDRGELLQPLAFQAVQQAPQLEHLLGQGGVGQPVQILGGKVAHSRREPGQPLGGLPEHLFEFMAATYQVRARTQAPRRKLGITSCSSLDVPARRR